MSRKTREQALKELAEINEKIVTRRYSEDQYMHIRNWLLVWKIEERGLSITEIADRSGLSTNQIYSFLKRVPKDRITSDCEKICRVLCCNPADIGYGLKFAPLKTPYRVDVTSLYKILDILGKGLTDIVHEMEIMKRSIAFIERQCFYPEFDEILKEGEKNGTCIQTETGKETHRGDREEGTETSIQEESGKTETPDQV